MLPLLRFEPLLKRIRWGGRRLGTLLSKHLGSEDDYAESWEIADHADGNSCVADGPFAGQTLSDLILSHPMELLGRSAGLKQFPLLIKFLDANDWLSLQVHPDDQLAKRYSPTENGKTEAWVIVDAEPDSRICSGLKCGVTAEDVRDGLQLGRIEQFLHFLPAKAGDCLLIPAGTVHAIGPGIVLAEVQQQSNLTFRLYDWGRVDASGNPRQLHIEDSLLSTNFDRGPVTAVPALAMSDELHSFEELVRCEYFAIRRHRSDARFRFVLNDSFRILMTLEGQGSAESRAGAAVLKRGDTILVPACAGNVEIIPNGSVTLLEVFCP